MPFFVDNCHGELAIPETAWDLGHSSGRSSHHRTTSKSIPIMVSGLENTTVPLAKARALSIDMKSVAFRQQGSDAVQAPVDTAEDAELERAIHRQRSSDLRMAVACCCSKRCLLILPESKFEPPLYPHATRALTPCSFDPSRCQGKFPLQREPPSGPGNSAAALHRSAGPGPCSFTFLQFQRAGRVVPSSMSRAPVIHL